MYKKNYYKDRAIDLTKFSSAAHHGLIYARNTGMADDGFVLGNMSLSLAI